MCKSLIYRLIYNFIIFTASVIKFIELSENRYADLENGV